MKKNLDKHFPLDFYGEDRGWRFIIRANEPSEVLDALRWRAYISIYRHEFNLLHLAVDKFSYTGVQTAKSSGIEGYTLRVKMLGPVVEVSTLNQLYHQRNGCPAVS
ncbi:MAG: hypothetical protein ACRC9T_02460 [Vibrionaceae bacterium]